MRPSSGVLVHMSVVQGGLECLPGTAAFSLLPTQPLLHSPALLPPTKPICHWVFVWMLED